MRPHASETPSPAQLQRSRGPSQSTGTMLGARGRRVGAAHHTVHVHLALEPGKPGTQLALVTALIKFLLLNRGQLPTSIEELKEASAGRVLRVLCHSTHIILPHAV